MYGSSQAPRSSLTGVPGWETESEQTYLYDLARAVPTGGLILEIGGEYGMSSSIFCLAVGRSAKVITIDLFPDEMLQQHIANLSDAGFGAISQQIVGDSHAVGKTWKDPIDLLFIDGDHSLVSVRQDIKLFTRHVVCGGKAVFHDVANPNWKEPHALHFEVAQAIHEWQGAKHNQWKPIAGVDRMLAFERRCFPR